MEENENNVEEEGKKNVAAEVDAPSTPDSSESVARRGSTSSVGSRRSSRFSGLFSAIRRNSTSTQEDGESRPRSSSLRNLFSRNADSPERRSSLVPPISTKATAAADDRADEEEKIDLPSPKQSVLDEVYGDFPPPPQFEEDFGGVQFSTSPKPPPMSPQPPPLSPGSADLLPPPPFDDEAASSLGAQFLPSNTSPIQKPGKIPPALPERKKTAAQEPPPPIEEAMEGAPTTHRRVPTIVNEMPSSTFPDDPKALATRPRGESATGRPISVSRQRGESTTNRLSRRTSKASPAPAALSPSVISTPSSTGSTRRHTLLDLQVAVAEARTNRKLSAQTESADESADTISPMVPGVTMLSPATQRAMTATGRPISVSVSSISDLADDPCDENNYVKVASLVLPPPFEDRSLVSGIKPDQVAVVMESVLTTPSSLSRASGFRFQSGDIVVTSAPRCGQSVILKMLDVLLLQENVDDIRGLIQAEETNMPTTEDDVYDILDNRSALETELKPGELPLPLPFRAPWLESAIFDQVSIEKFAQKRNGRRVFKTHLGHSTLRGLHKPGVKFIIVARDPIDLRLSNFRYHRKMYRKSVAEEQRPFDEEFSLDSFARVTPMLCKMNRSTGAGLETYTDKSKLHPDALIEHASESNGYESDLASWAKETIPHSVMIFFYEELCSEPLKSCERLAEFLQLDNSMSHLHSRNELKPIERKRIEAAVKRVLKDPLFPMKTVSKAMTIASTQKTKVQLRIEELERKERAVLGIRKIEQEEEPDVHVRQAQKLHTRPVSGRARLASVALGIPLDELTLTQTDTSTSTSTQQQRMFGAAGAGGAPPPTRIRGESDADPGHRRARSNVSSTSSVPAEPGARGCIQLGHRLFDDLDIEWLDDEWDMYVRIRIPAAISYEHFYKKVLGPNFPFGQRDRPKNVRMERAKARQIEERKEKGVARRVSSLFIGGGHG